LANESISIKNMRVLANIASNQISKLTDNKYLVTKGLVEKLLAERYSLKMTDTGVEIDDTTFDYFIDAKKKHEEKKAWIHNEGMSQNIMPFYSANKFHK
jgi:predicted transcriptional regulator of viral defense system